MVVGEAVNVTQFPIIKHRNTQNWLRRWLTGCLKRATRFCHGADSLGMSAPTEGRILCGENPA